MSLVMQARKGTVSEMGRVRRLIMSEWPSKGYNLKVTSFLLYGFESLQVHIKFPAIFLGGVNQSWIRQLGGAGLTNGPVGPYCGCLD